MIYKFTYYYNNKLINETYNNDVLAMYRFNYLSERKIPFKIITILKRRNLYYDKI